MKLKLQHCKNVDYMYGQGNGTGYNSDPVDPKTMTVEVKNLEEAVQQHQAWVERNGLGGGNMTKQCGKVTDGKKLVGYISYNGRVWDGPYYAQPCNEILVNPNQKTTKQLDAEGWVDFQPVKLAQYRAIFQSASDMMEMCADLEPTSALKQAASDAGIAYGDDMAKFVAWAHWEIAHPKAKVVAAPDEVQDPAPAPFARMERLTVEQAEAFDDILCNYPDGIGDEVVAIHRCATTGFYVEETRKRGKHHDLVFHAAIDCYEDTFVTLEDAVAWLKEQWSEMYPHLKAKAPAEVNQGAADRSHWDEVPGHPVEDWRAEVANDDTRLGYLAWVDARIEQEKLLPA